jgi:glycosyltransferase involved in cell wall biosynthesis
MHTWNVVRELSKFFTTSLYVSTQIPEVSWDKLAEVCDEVGAFQRRPDRSINFDPPAVRQEFSPALVTHLQRRWHAHAPAIVQLEATTLLRYAPLARAHGASVVCSIHSLGFLSQIRRSKAEPNPIIRLRRLLGALSFWQYELRGLRGCDLILTLGEADRQVLLRWLPHIPIVTIPSGIDLNTWQPCFNLDVEDRVLFVGNFRHPPNIEGALWLVREVWPYVLQVRPHARLILAGREPPANLQALASASIEVPGTLEQMQPLYQQASLFVAPIFWGSGIRIKLLEALACGLPIVTTRIAAEGMDVRASALVAETPGAFADAILRLLGDPALRSAMGAAGPMVVRRDYDWEQLGKRTAGLYYGVRAGMKR